MPQPGPSLVTGTPLGNVIGQENTYLEGAPYIYFQDALATPLNNPDGDGFYWGLPVLEAMGCGVPCVTTDTGALTELLQDGRGVLIPPVLSVIDVWGNSKRDWINMDTAAEVIGNLMLEGNSDYKDQMVKRAQAYIQSRTWDGPVQQVHAKILELFPNESTPTKA